MTEREYQRAVVAALNAELGARGWTRKHLGERAGITEQTMMRIFRCERDMNVEQLGAMLNALGVTAQYLAMEAERRRASNIPHQERHLAPESERDAR
jgi:transcriptional regulator with XRE-family HTH domain